MPTHQNAPKSDRRRNTEWDPEYIPDTNICLSVLFLTVLNHLSAISASMMWGFTRGQVKRLTDIEREKITVSRWPRWCKIEGWKCRLLWICCVILQVKHQSDGKKVPIPVHTVTSIFYQDSEGGGPQRFWPFSSSHPCIIMSVLFPNFFSILCYSYPCFHIWSNSWTVQGDNSKKTTRVLSTIIDGLQLPAFVYLLICRHKKPCLCNLSVIFTSPYTHFKYSSRQKFRGTVDFGE